MGHFYKFKDQEGTHIGQYVGNEDGFECVVCGKGCKARCFNIWYDKEGGYETCGFGPNHMPRIIEDLGEEEIILDNQNNKLNAKVSKSSR